MTAASVDAPPRHRRRPKSRRVPSVPPLRGLLSVAVFLLIWQYVGDAGSVSFPPPSTWIEALGERWAAGQLQAALVVSGKTFAAGLLVASALGISLGIAIGASKPLNRALSPIMDFFRSLPGPVIVPLVALIVGPTLRSAIIIVAFASTWPLLLNTAASMRAMPTVRMDMARSFGVSPPSRLFKVVLPSIADGVVIGLRLGVVVAMVVTLFTEYLAITRGLGFLMLERQQRLDAASVWGLVLLIGMLGYSLTIAVALLEARVMRSRSVD